MIRHAVEQNSEEWQKLRLGVATSSEFKRIVTPKGKLSTQAAGYMYRLLAEWIVGEPLDNLETDWMVRGHDLEERAFRSFEFETGLDTEPGGFITADNGLIGTSPDRLIVGERSGLELKCPAPQTHVCYMVTRCVDEEYMPQVQGQMLVAELERVYIQSYCPGFPTVVLPVKRDEKYISFLQDALDCFVDNMLNVREKLVHEYGAFRQKKQPNMQVRPDEFITAEDAEIIIRAKFPQGAGAV